MTRYETIREALEAMSAQEIINIHNAYCEATNTTNYYIYAMDDFDEIMEGLTPTDIAWRIYCGDFNPNREYFWFNGYANLESSDYAPDIIFIDDIARYIDEEDDDLQSLTIEEILEDYNEAV